MRLWLFSLAALALAACSDAAREPAGPAAPGAAGTAAATPTVSASAPARSSARDLATAARTTQEGADTGVTNSGDESALERVAALSPAGQLPQVGEWQAGRHYEVIVPSQPTSAPADKVEVLEFFWYHCPHCYALEPDVIKWLQSKPEFIQFTRVPVTWDAEHLAQAHLFYTLEALGKLESLHAKAFDTIHAGNALWVPGDEAATLAAQVKFAEANGISGDAYRAAYDQAAVKHRVEVADDLSRRYRIGSVPTFVIAGKYSTDGQRAGGEEALFRLINEMAAHEHHR